MLTLPSLFRGVHQKSAELADLTGDLQKFLLGQGFQIRVDENFGPKTEAVVSEYQVSRDLKGDGRVGPQTWGALLKDGFRPKDFAVDPDGFDPKAGENWPPKPLGVRSPNGRYLWGDSFSYTPKPLPGNPEYVEPAPAWRKRNIGVADIPELAKVRGARNGQIEFNLKLIPQLQELFSVLGKKGLSGRVLTFDGSWVTRYVRGRDDRLSNHSFGAAFDINARWNGFRTQPALLGDVGCVRELVEDAFLLGFYWGGWYNDGMHFEAYKVVSV